MARASNPKNCTQNRLPHTFLLSNIAGDIMSKLIDLTGQKFNRLTVIKRAKSNRHGDTMWLCLCECGNTHTVWMKSLRNGGVKSCGCLGNEKRKTNCKTHGGANSSEYRVWQGIKDRCHNINSWSYKDYGGRGIAVCDRWRNSFVNFLEDIGERPSAEYTIERTNNNLGYNKENCKWATIAEQANNKRSNVVIDYDGRIQTLAQWCRELSLPYDKIYQRIQASGWSAEKAFTT